MKNKFIFLSVTFSTVLTFSTSMFSQTNKSAAPDTTEKFLQRAFTDFAVPDAPAFKILQAEPSTVLRPTSPRAVAVTIANLLKGGTIPDNYALEISPGLLFSNSLSDFQKSPTLYRTRISFATKTLENSTRNVGAGIRVTLYDGTDLRLDETLMEDVIKFSSLLFDIDKRCREKVKADNRIDEFDDKFDDLFFACRDSVRSKIKLDSVKIREKIIKLRETAKQRNWNKPIVELGFATSAQSGDSLAKNLMVNSHQLWFIAALPLGSDGQVITGLNAGLSKDKNNEMKRGEGSLGVRAYWGTNAQKLFVEGNVKAASEILPSYSLNIGYEYNLMNGVWADLSLGLIKKDGSKFVSNSSLNFRFATPE